MALSFSDKVKHGQTARACYDSELTAVQAITFLVQRSKLDQTDAETVIGTFAYNQKAAYGRVLRDDWAARAQSTGSASSTGGMVKSQIAAFKASLNNDPMTKK